MRVLKFGLLALIALVPLPSGLTTSLPAVRADSGSHKIIVLPFVTGWEQSNILSSDPLGTSTCSCNQVYQKTDNLLGIGGGSGTNPSLSLAQYLPGTPINFQGAYGFTTGGKNDTSYLQASGYFNTSGSWGTLRLFDPSPQSDFQTPFRLQPHTFLSVWYYHQSNGVNNASNNVMLDANLYDAHANKYYTLGSFQDGRGNSVVDQNGIQLNAASRGNDPQNSWAHAEFDLSLIYNSDPGPNNWWVTMITVRFDNSISGVTGNATTFFDDVRFTYGVSQATTIQLKNTQYGNDNAGTLIIVGSAEIWQITGITNGQYTVEVKLGTMGWTNATVGSGPPASQGYEWWPDIMNQSFLTLGGFLPASLGAFTAPFGTNVTYLNYTRPNTWNAWSHWAFGEFELLWTTAYAIPGFIYSEAKLFYQLYQELHNSTGTNSLGFASYVWPQATNQYGCWGYPNCPSHPIPNSLNGISFAQFLAPKTGGTITLQDTVSFAYSSSNDVALSGNSATLSISWPGDPTVNNQAPSTPTLTGPQGSGGSPGTSYTWAACSTDAEGEIVRYHFYWGDNTNTTTDWISSSNGYCGQGTHAYSGTGNYNVYAYAEDAAHLLSGNSVTLVVTINILQNDCGSGGDAGNSIGAATASSSIPGTCSGYLNSAFDTQDWYKFNVVSPATIRVSVAPPSGATYSSELYNPSGALSAGFYPSGPTTPPTNDTYTYTACTTGNWTTRVFTSSGSGTYTISVTISSGSCAPVYTGGSIMAGTQVLMSDGSSKQVQNIAAGMVIRSFDPATHGFFNATVTSLVPRSVNNLYVISTSIGNPIRVDYYEDFWVQLPNGQVQWMHAGQVQVGDKILRPVEGVWATITSIEMDTGNYTVYDLIVTPTLPGGGISVIANGYLDRKVP